MVIWYISWKTKLKNLKRSLICSSYPCPKDRPKALILRLTSVQYSLDLCAKTIEITVVNDDLRELFSKFAMQKINVYHELCKYGKTKGWLKVPPYMQPQ